MAGYMYLGSQKVCPAVLVGGGGEPTEYFTFKFPDGLKTFDGILQFASNAISVEDYYWNKLPVCFDFNELEYIDEGALLNMGLGCNSVIIKNLSSIKKIYGFQSLLSCFSNCTFENGPVDIVFGGLEEVNGEMCLYYSFMSSSIRSIHLPKLTKIGSKSLWGFGNYNGIEIYFEAVKTSTFTTGNELYEICGGTGSTISGKKLHFPSNLSSVIPNQSGYPNFGGTNTVILYDLPATE